jgi:uncharacterized membrane protein YjdF
MAGNKLVRRSKGDHIQYFVMNALSVFLLAATTWALINGQYEVALLSALVFGSRFLPKIIERRYKISLPIEFHATVYFFMFASVFIGSISGAYIAFWWWDMALHFLSGLAASFGAFLFLYTLYVQSKLEITPLAGAFFTFCVGLAIGAVWEIAEYTADSLLHLGSQRGDLQDTMQDLIFDALGALFISAAGYFYLKREEPRRNPIKRFVTNFERHNPKLFNKKARHPD